LIKEGMTSWGSMGWGVGIITALVILFGSLGRYAPDGG
jgi:hypothetical protein